MRARLSALLLTAPAVSQRIEVTAPPNLDGHLILVIAKDDPKSAPEEPRNQLSEDYHSAQAFGVDVDDSSGPIVVNTKTFGYPRKSLADLDPGDYTVQAVFNVYEAFHFAVGDGDTFFLNNAVHLLQTQLDATTNSHSDATFQYGPGMPHCYTGGPAEYTMQQNNANWTQRVLPLMTDHMLKTAPTGADTKSWRY